LVRHPNIPPRFVRPSVRPSHPRPSFCSSPPPARSYPRPLPHVSSPTLAAALQPSTTALASSRVDRAAAGPAATELHPILSPTRALVSELAPLPCSPLRPSRHPCCRSVPTAALSPPSSMPPLLHPWPPRRPRRRYSTGRQIHEVLRATSQPALFSFSELLTLSTCSKVRPPSASASSARPWRSPPGVGLGFNYFPPSPRRLRGVRLDLTLVCDWLFRLFVGAARWHAVRVVTGRPPALCLRDLEGLQE